MAVTEQYRKHIAMWQNVGNDSRIRQYEVERKEQADWLLTNLSQSTTEINATSNRSRACCGTNYLDDPDNYAHTPRLSQRKQH